MIILLVGKSGTGKDYICEMFNLRRVISMTTRIPRPYERDGVHKHFVDRSIIENHKVERTLVAYTIFDGHMYGATRDLLKDKDVYVIDPDGVRFFQSHSEGVEYKVVLVKAPWYRRMNRLIKRHRTKGRGLAETKGSFWKAL